VRVALAVEIEPMKLEDIEDVHRIERQVYPTPWSIAVFRTEVARRQHNIYLVAKYEDQVIGYICLFHVFDEGHITNVAVDPKYQRQGIGTRLLLTAINKAITVGVRYVTLEVRESNLIAQHLYRKFGFRLTGRRQGYYSDTKEDALVFWAGDITSPEYQQKLAAIAKKLEQGVA
jgi:ribosomal-protein-alanine N-acetyltransferase